MSGTHDDRNDFAAKPQTFVSVTFDILCDVNQQPKYLGRQKK